jgi:hypothetical protein
LTFKNEKDVISRSRLQWFGITERKSDDSWVKPRVMLQVEGNRSRGRPQKILLDMIKVLIRTLVFREEDSKTDYYVVR